MIDPKAVTTSSQSAQRIHVPNWFIPLVTLALGLSILALGDGLLPSADRSPLALLNLVTGSALGAVVFVQQFQAEIGDVYRAMFRGLRAPAAALGATAVGAALVGAFVDAA